MTTQRLRILGFTTLGALVLCANPAEADNRYVGVKRCERCHNSADSGKQVDVWRTRKHAKAMEVLSSPEAKKVGAQRGVSDPATDARCVKCHDTGYGKKKAQLGKSFKMNQGVQCESCHGPSERHFRLRFDAQQEEDEYEYEDEYEDDGEPELLMSLPEGELAPVNEKTCEECHNKESPTFKPFCYCERTQKIAHWDPRREKVRGKKALAMRPCPCEE